MARGKLYSRLLATVPEQPQGNLNPAPPGSGNCTVQLLTLNEPGSFPGGTLKEPFLGCFITPFYPSPHVPDDPRGLVAGTVELGRVWLTRLVCPGAVLGRSFLVELGAPADFHLSWVLRGLRERMEEQFKS